jgi:type IV pilus assembly protein PilA
VIRRSGASRERDAGFTLIELLIVVVIIGILAAIAVPLFLSQREKGYDATMKSDLRNLSVAEDTFLHNGADRYGTMDEVRAGTDVKASKGVTLRVVRYNSLVGYCLSATHSGSGDTWYYDSQAGGIQAPVGTACPVTQSGTPGGNPLSNP